MIVRFFYITKGFSFTKRSALKRFLGSIFKNEKQAFKELNVIFCSDEYLLQVNRDFLAHDYYTDIITFNLSNPGEPVKGEVYISVDRVKDNAFILGIPFKMELHRVIVHGVLHLCGYTDKKAVEVKQMRTLEEKYLKLYFKGST